MARKTTLLDLVKAVTEYACSEDEIVAPVAYMVNRGHVRLCGTLMDARFDLTQLSAA